MFPASNPILATLALLQVDWRAFGQHFGRSYESVSYKYSYIKNTGRTGECRLQALSGNTLEARTWASGCKSSTP